MTQSKPDITALREDTSIQRLRILLRPYIGRIFVAFLTLLVLAGVNMAVPLCIKLMIDDIFPNTNWQLLWFTLVGLLLCYLARNILYFYSKTAAVQIGENICFNLRNRLFDRMQHMTLRYYRQTRPGQMSGRVMDDSFLIQSFIQDDLPKLLLASCMFMGLVAVLYAVNWQLALAATVVLPLHLLAFHWFKRPIKDSSSVAQEQLAILHGNLIERFLGMEVIKSCTAEQRESEAFVRATDLSRRSQLRSKSYHVTQKIVGDLLIGVATVALLGFGAYQVIGRTDGAMEMGTFVVFFAWVGMLYPTVLQLTNGLAKMTRCTASVDRVFELLESGLTEPRRRSAVRAPIHGHLVYENVCFTYDDGVPVLKKANLEVKPGQVCAIVGPSGAGKSTLVNLLPRFIDPQLGRVLIDSVETCQIDMHHLREQIGIAFQECFLFNSSILDNLSYANPGATVPRVIEVAKLTGAHDFIEKLPEGYATQVGDGGHTLSRGEKQRINLTRALLKDPKILILDEATASLDLAAESQIVPAILKLMRGRTTLMITHRPEMIRHADVVVQLVDGRITYHGPPDGLPPDALQIEPSSEPPKVAHGIGATDDPPAKIKPDVTRSGIWQSLNALILAASMALAGTVYAQNAVPPLAEALDPATGGKFIAMAGVSGFEVRELIDVVVARAGAELGYRQADRLLTKMLPAVPGPIRDPIVLARTDNGKTHLLQLGYRVYRSQPVHVWMMGRHLDGQDNIAANPDLATVEKYLLAARAQRDKQHHAISVTDLASKKIKLSYIEPDRCLLTLGLLGYTVIKPGDKVDPKQLPAIVEMPPTSHNNLIPFRDESGLDLSFPSTVTDPINELLVMYHPANPEQYAQVLEHIRTTIDVPARQIMIEAMVLEISELGLERLGIEWQLESPGKNIEGLMLGRLPAFATRTDQVPTLDIEFKNVLGDFSVKVQALVREGYAKILSRPSVLTIDNRMAFIDVARRIPVVQSVAVPNSGTVTTNFKEVRAGITLSVRPRVSADGQEVSMQVVTLVTNEVPNEEVIVLNNDGNEVARAPTISERRVHATTRIANNTPFIIGGLISKDDVSDTDKVPLLGDIPLLGNLFRSKRSNTLAREVIIVITPYVLPENRIVARNLPKDDDAFDNFGNKLFRDAYRIRAEDVFDLGFIYQNRQLRLMQAMAQRIATDNPDLGQIYPIIRFTGGAVPGEDVLVYRQMYEVIKRRKIGQNIGMDKVILFAPDENSESGFTVIRLRQYLAEQLGMEGYRETPPASAYASQLKGKALALTYTLQSNQADPKDILSQPVPRLHVLECADEQEYSRLLWQWNQPDAEGRQRYTILIHGPKDVDRIKRAIVLKRVVHLNADRHALTLSNYSLGRLLFMPTIKPEKVYVIDEQVAKLFFYSDQYYPVVRRMLTRDIEAFRNLLKDRMFEKYTDRPILFGEDVQPILLK